mmetsp:Transcript_21096/g.42766  ORF Transcript_21096/g.42766 Transcript_21096/m.42766 type:complete len:81 (-) Transcript_21096:285-527(-)
MPVLSDQRHGRHAVLLRPSPLIIIMVTPSNPHIGVADPIRAGLTHAAEQIGIDGPPTDLAPQQVLLVPPALVMHRGDASA